MFRRLIGTALAALAFLAVSASATALPRSDGAVIGKGYIYAANGRLVGHIERVGPEVWNVSDSCNSQVELFSDHRMQITEGFHYFGFARRRGATRWDVYSFGPDYEGSVRRVTPTRWNVYRRSRRVGHTRGRGLNAVAAGFAYVFWYGAGCFDL